MSKGRILLVEPDDDIREWIEAALEADAYEVWAVDSAEKGLELLDEIEPHFLLLDNLYDRIEWNPEYIDFQYKNIPQVWMYREQFRSDQIGEFIPEIPNGSIRKLPLDENDRSKLKNAVRIYSDLKPKKDVWIVSPDEEIREILQIYLSHKGFSVTAFRFATKAFVELQKVHQPDILLMWNSVPYKHKHGGIDIENQALHAYCAGRKIPFLFISQVPDRFDYLPYNDLELGADLMEISMPFDIEEFRMRVELLLK